MDSNYILSTHRAWLHASYMRNLFLQDSEPLPIKGPTFFVKPRGAYLLLWYGLLYNICDTLSNNHSMPETLIADYEAIKTQLEICRHYTLHIKPDYQKMDQFGIFFLDKSRGRVERLHQELGKYLTELIAPQVPEDMRNYILKSDDLSEGDILRVFGYKI
jgi:hypothetical protein